MNIIRNLILGAMALGAFAIATPAQAHDHGHYGCHGYHGGYYHHHGWWGGPSISFGYGGPYYYGYDPYYYNAYYNPYPVYGYAPGFSIGFGGHRYYHHHYYYRHHHRW